jgi:hypothetical protein
VESLLRVNGVEQPKLGVVEHLVLLPLAERLDGQPELLASVWSSGPL